MKSIIQGPQCTLRGYWSNLWILCPVDPVQSHFGSLGAEWEVFQPSAKPKPTAKIMKSFDPLAVTSSRNHSGVTQLEKALPAFSLSQAQGLGPKAGSRGSIEAGVPGIKPVSCQQSLPDEFTTTLIVHFQRHTFDKCRTL